MTELAIAPAGDVWVLDLWNGHDLPPGLAGIRVEPRRWWLFGPLDPAGIGEAGIPVPIGGGLMRATLTGAGWRELLTVSGWFDTDTLAPGDAAATIIHHVPVWIHAVAAAEAHVYFPASYTETLSRLWTRALAGP